MSGYFNAKRINMKPITNHHTAGIRKALHSGTVAVTVVLLLFLTAHCSDKEPVKVKYASLSFQCSGTHDFESQDVHLDEDGICSTEISFSMENGQWVWFCLDDVVAKTYQLSGANYAVVRMDFFSTDEISSTDGTITLHSLDKGKGNYEAGFDFNASDPGTCLTVHFTGTASITD